MAGTLTKSVRIPRETLEEIKHEFRDRDFSSVANELLTEGVKMRRCPGIVFTDGPGGKRSARVAGTGSSVWVIIAGYKSMNEDWSRLRQAYHWLGEEQLRAALNYYTCYPDEIDSQVRANEAVASQTLYERYPFMRPSDAEVLPRRGSKPENRRNSPKRRARRR